MDAGVLIRLGFSSVVDFDLEIVVEVEESGEVELLLPQATLRLVNSLLSQGYVPQTLLLLPVEVVLFNTVLR